MMHEVASIDRLVATAVVTSQYFFNGGRVFLVGLGCFVEECVCSDRGGNDRYERRDRYIFYCVSLSLCLSLSLSLSLFDVIIVVLVVGMMIAVAVVVEMSAEAAVGDRRVDNKVAKNVFFIHTRLFNLNTP
jgi:hypothetical protein